MHNLKLKKKIYRKNKEKRLDAISLHATSRSLYYLKIKIIRQFETFLTRQDNFDSKMFLLFLRYFENDFNSFKSLL